jgi:hypothetical protein
MADLIDINERRREKTQVKMAASLSKKIECIVNDAIYGGLEPELATTLLFEMTRRAARATGKQDQLEYHFVCLLTQETPA